MYCVDCERALTVRHYDLCSVCSTKRIKDLMKRGKTEEYARGYLDALYRIGIRTFGEVERGFVGWEVYDLNGGVFSGVSLQNHLHADIDDIVTICR